MVRPRQRRRILRNLLLPMVEQGTRRRWSRQDLEQTSVSPNPPSILKTPVLIRETSSYGKLGRKKGY